MNFFRDVLPLLFSLVAVAGVLYLSYRFSKFLASRVNQSNNSNNMRVMERVALGQDKGIAIVQICGNYCLLGFSNNTITILKELPDYHEAEVSKNPPDFLSLLKETVKGKTNSKAGEKDDVDGEK